MGCQERRNERASSAATLFLRTNFYGPRIHNLHDLWKVASIPITPSLFIRVGQEFLLSKNRSVSVGNAYQVFRYETDVKMIRV